MDVILVRRLGQSQLGAAGDVTEVAAVDRLDGRKDAEAHPLKGSGDGVGLLLLKKLCVLQYKLTNQFIMSMRFL